MAIVVWFTGLSGSGKTTIALKLKENLEEQGKNVEIFDGDIIRKTIHKHLGFSRKDIKENNLAIAKLAKDKIDHFDVILVPIMSPYKEDREQARKLLGKNFIELYIKCSLEKCKVRDVKGIYKKFANGEISGIIGVNRPYEPPDKPDIIIDTESLSLEQSVKLICDFLDKQIIGPDIQLLDMDFPFDASEETRAAVNAALKAGKAVLDIYSTKFSPTFKYDKEPITQADIRSNELIIHILSKFNFPILSEEGKDDLTRLNSCKLWIIDPLDGTMDFIQKTGEFSIMIALVEGNKAVLGVVYQPTEEVLFISQKDKGAYVYSKGKWESMHVSDISILSNCRIITSRNHFSTNDRLLVKKLGILKHIKKGSAGLKVAEICNGNAEVYFTSTDKIKQWDTCAAYSLITESGGAITDLLGNDILYNTRYLNHKYGLLVSNGIIHDEIIKQYAEFRKDNYN